MLVVCVRSVVSCTHHKAVLSVGMAVAVIALTTFSSVCCVAVIDICRLASLSSRDVVSTRSDAPCFICGSRGVD